MKPFSKASFVLPVLIAAYGIVPVMLTAQTFKVLHTFAAGAYSSTSQNSAIFYTNSDGANLKGRKRGKRGQLRRLCKLAGLRFDRAGPVGTRAFRCVTNCRSNPVVSTHQVDNLFQEGTQMADGNVANGK